MQLSPIDQHCLFLDTDQNFYPSAASVSSPEDFLKAMDNPDPFCSGMQEAVHQNMPLFPQDESFPPLENILEIPEEFQTTESNVGLNGEEIPQMIQDYLCSDNTSDFQNNGLDLMQQIPQEPILNHSNVTTANFQQSWTPNPHDYPQYSFTVTGTPPSQFTSPETTPWQNHTQSIINIYGNLDENIAEQVPVESADQYFTPVIPYQGYQHSGYYQTSPSPSVMTGGKSPINSNVRSHLKTHIERRTQDYKGPSNLFPTSRVKQKQQQQHLTPEDEAKRLDRKLKNKAAATKCRKKKQEEQRRTEVDARYLEEEHNSLTRDILMLQQEKHHLEQILGGHKCALKF